MSDKWKIILSVIGVFVSITLFVVSAFLAENAVIQPISATLLIMVTTGLLFVAIFFAAKVDYDSSVYKCRKCGHNFKPTFKVYFFGAHTLTTRHLKCPKCDEKSWCKRKFEKV